MDEAVNLITVQDYAKIYKEHGIHVLHSEAELRFAAAYADHILRSFIQQLQEDAAKKAAAEKIV